MIRTLERSARLDLSTVSAPRAEPIAAFDDRQRPSRRALSGSSCPATSLEPAKFLQNFDFMSVRVSHEEKLAKWLAAPLHLFDRTWGKTFALKSDVLGTDVVNDKSDLAAAVAEIVGLRAVAVHLSLNLARR